MDAFIPVIIIIAFSLIFVVVTSIKDKTNIVDDLISFFAEWKQNAIPGIIFICIIAIICWAWFG